MIRGWRLFPLLGIGIFLWLFMMAILPTVDSRQSPLLIPGFLFVSLIFVGVLSTQIIFSKSPRAITAGANFTLSNSEPLKKVKVADFKNSPGLEEYNIYALNGTPIGPILGGGLEGYSVIPSHLDYNALGQHFWNVLWQVYRKTPNKRRGEKPLIFLPKPILESLRSIEGWKEESPVWFGRLPLIKPENMVIKNIDLKDELDLMNAQKNSLEETNEKYRTTLSQQTELIRDILRSYPQAQREVEKRNYDWMRGSGGE